MSTDREADAGLSPLLAEAVQSIATASLDMAAIDRVRQGARQLAARPGRALGAQSRRLRNKISARRTRTRRVLLAAAALVLLGVWLLWPDSQAAAIAQVEAALKRVTTASYRVTQRIGDQPEQVTKVSLRDGVCRAERPDGSIFLFDSIRHRLLHLNPATKSCRLIEGATVPGGFDLAGFLADLRRHAANIQPGVGERTIDGKRAQGFVVDAGGVAYGVWVDPETGLPLHFELSQHRSEGLTGNGTGIEMEEVWTDFKFHENFDAALFNSDPPADYAVDVQRHEDREKRIEDQKRRAEEQLGLAKSAPANSPSIASKNFVIRPLVGVGPVQFGMTPEQVVERLGQPDYQRDIVQQGQVALGYRKLGLHLIFRTGNDGLWSVICMSSRQETHFSRESQPEHGFAGKTEKEVGIGAKLQDVVAQYGEPDATQDYVGVPGVVEKAYDKLRLAFLIQDGDVIEIHVLKSNPGSVNK